MSSATTPQPLHILIAGAGIGGLTAALALRRQGHKTTIFEQSRLANEIGAAINIAPNCNGILRRLGLFLENHGAVDCTAFYFYDHNANVLQSMQWDKVKERFGSPYHLMHRAHLHKGIKDLVLSKEGEGMPSELRTSSRVVDVDPERATIKLASGEEIQGDVVIGADGVHSLTRPRLPGASTITPFSSGMCGFRFLVPTSSLAADPLTAPFVSQPGMLGRFNSAEDKQTLVVYPCQSNEIMNCMLALPSLASTAGQSTDWRAEASKAYMLEVASKAFGPVPRAFLEKAAEDGVRLYELEDMQELPTWVSGRLALMGDAAHPFTPWRGQGGAMAIEDAASLGVLLPLGTTPEQVPARLELYQSCRRERAHAIQDQSRKNSPLSTEAVQQDRSQSAFQAFAQALLGFDEWKHSEEALAKATASGAPAVAVGA